jgi:hypothetical protein
MMAALIDLPTLALAALAAAVPGSPQTPEWSPAMLQACVTAMRARVGGAGPTGASRHADYRLVATASALGLTDAEIMAVALCLAAERDPEAARAVADAQSPIGRSRPLLGLAVSALAPLGATSAGIAFGRAAASGLLRLGDEAVALPERSLSVPLPIQAALAGSTMAPEGVRLVTPRRIPLPEEVANEAASRAATLRAQMRMGLIIRARSAEDGQAVAVLVARAMDRQLARFEPARDTPIPGLAPWLIASETIPLFIPDLGPGQRWAVPHIPFHDGPWLVVTSTEASVETEDAVDDWTVPVPDTGAREQLWRASGVAPDLAGRAAETFRHGAARIAEVADRARREAIRRALAIGPSPDGDPSPDWSDITAAIALGAASLDALAHRGGGEVPDEALVLPPSLRDALDQLLDRVRVRGTLADGLGPAVRARYRPGVRALLVGESGTGKTLAANWLAARLGLPLYRVDLAALTSKYIGETEKNLSAILAAAEHADVLLFFDEADALFGARTDLGDAHDRYANAQTNYLLQRIEDFDGIAVLASNSRDRFDPAFTRRLDAILEFPMPEGPARHALWTAHLGVLHRLQEEHLDRLSVAVDLAGGHIRNIVLAAAARARGRAVPIGWQDIVPAVREEYAKLGRPPPDLGPC